MDVYFFSGIFDSFLSIIHSIVNPFPCVVNFLLSIILKGIFLSEVIVVGVQNAVYADVVWKHLTYQVVQADSILLLEGDSVGLAVI